ncbi:MAG: hypothetical protein M3336_12010 [Chloroflexota bacterium]|nr:hypothetical protein [Chloroflexota bacterium]
MPGRGRPLAGESWDGEWGLAHHVLRQAGETLPWIALGGEIELAQQALRERLAAAARLPRGGPDWREARERARQCYLDQAAALDKMLVDYAFLVPVRSLERGRLPRVIAERQFDTACPP